MEISLIIQLLDGKDKILKVTTYVVNAEVCFFCGSELMSFGDQSCIWTEKS